MEILVVLAILAILSSAAIFSYGSYRKTLSVRSTTQEITSLFSTARSLAINSNRPHSATLDLDAQEFWIDELSPDATAVARPKLSGTARPADFVVIDDVALASGIQTTGLIKILFWPDGRGTYAIVHVRRDLDDPALSSSYHSIQVFASTGATRVYPNERR
jgi:Tfp pilus assembly protein FimT